MKNIYGTKLYLKEIQIDELDDRVMEWFKDDDLMKYYTNSRKKIDRNTLIASINKGKEDGNVFTYGIYDISTDLLIGTIKLGPISKLHKTSDLATLIGDRNFLGKGLASEAIRLGNKLAFTHYDIRKLYGGMYYSNIASIKAYLKADWLIEGRLKGFYYVNGKNEDRLLVCCFNPAYFTKDDIDEIKRKQEEYYVGQ